MIQKPHVDWFALSPSLAMLGAAALLMLVAVFWPKSSRRDASAVTAAAGFVTAFVLAILVAEKSPHATTIIADSLYRDRWAATAQLIVSACGLVAVLIAYREPMREENIAEYYLLLAASAAGMAFFVQAANLLTLFLGLEWFSVALYVLCAIDVDLVGSLEAGLKYLVIGAVGSATLLFGSALVYGATGELSFDKIAAAGHAHDSLLVLGLAMMIAGFAFKASAAPFHMWTPDAYEGAPTSVTGFMSAGAKAAGFAALLRILMRALPSLQHDWTPLLSAVAMLTMTVGNVTALLQNNVKRMLAYSSIAHAGYILVALAAGGHDGSAAAVFYLAVYSFMNLGAFALLTMMGRGSDEPVLVSDLAGLGFRQPLAGFALTLFMVSLGGIPPTAGFMGKVLVFGAAVKAGLVWPLVVVGVLNSVVSVFYYLRITVALYMREPEGEPVALSLNAPAVAALLLTAGATLWWGLQAHSLWQAAQRSVLGIL